MKTILIILLIVAIIWGLYELWQKNGDNILFGKKRHSADQ